MSFTKIHVYNSKRAKETEHPSAKFWLKNRKEIKNESLLTRHDELGTYCVNK